MVFTVMVAAMAQPRRKPSALAKCSKPMLNAVPVVYHWKYKMDEVTL